MKLFVRISLILFIIIFNKSVLAQNRAKRDTTESFINKNFSVSGDISFYGELYSISGITARRPSSTGRLLIRPTFTFFNNISIPVEIILSTEGSSARQNINQFGINPAWSWGKAHLGDFSESYSDFTLNGIVIRGGGIDLNPGILRFSTVAGFTQQAVNGGAQNGSYKRFLFASKIGVGKDNSTHVDFIFLRSKDDVSSINLTQKSITVITPNGDDQVPVGTLQTVRWASTGITGDVNIELSRDGGATFQTIFSDQPANGFVNWSASGPDTYQAIIKITSINDSSISDVSDYPFTIASGIQAKTGNHFKGNYNQSSISPQENLVLGTVGKISLDDNKFVINFEASGSVYTRDLRSSEINLDSTNIPSLFSSLYKPRSSSSYDYAVNTDFNLNLQTFKLKIGYKQIGPGYHSLGLAYLQNDQRQFTAITSYRFSRYSVSANWIRFSDNLIDQKAYTTSRNQFGVNFNGLLTKFWNANILINFLNMGNDSKNDTSKVDFSSLVLGMNHVFMIGQQSFLQNISINYTYQKSENNSALFSGSVTKVNNVNLGLAFYISENLSANSSFGLVSSTYADTISSNTKIVSLGLNHNALSNKLHTSFSVSSSFLQNNSSYRTILSSGYSFTRTDKISLTISYNAFRTTETKGGNFNEIIAGLNYSHSF